MKEILGNGLDTIVSQALQKMKEEQGESFRIETVNLAALQRMTGISRFFRQNNVPERKSLF